MKWFTALRAYLEGKKTTIGVTVWAVYMMLVEFDVLAYSEYAIIIIAAWTGLSVSSKINRVASRQ